jgi:hypothetical protein
MTQSPVLWRATIGRQVENQRGPKGFCNGSGIFVPRSGHRIGPRASQYRSADSKRCEARFTGFGGGTPPRWSWLRYEPLDDAAAEVHDTCLWMKLAEATGARGDSTALVEDEETARTEFVVGRRPGVPWRPYRELRAEQYGAELIPLVRKLVAETDARSPGQR